MQKIRKILGSFWFIHLMAFLVLFTLFGYIMYDRQYLLFFVVLSFLGEICGSFIRVIDAIKSSK